MPRVQNDREGSAEPLKVRPRQIHLENLRKEEARETRPPAGGLHKPPYFLTLPSAEERKKKKKAKCICGGGELLPACLLLCKITGEPALGTEGQVLGKYRRKESR